MQQHIYYNKYALQFADMQISELVTEFNHQVGNTGWTGMRAYHNQALFDEFQRRGIDTSCVYDGHSIYFSHHVRYNVSENKIEQVAWLIIYNIVPLQAVCSLLGAEFYNVS